MNNKPINPSPELVAHVAKQLEPMLIGLGKGLAKLMSEEMAVKAIQAMPDACAIVDRLVEALGPAVFHDVYMKYRANSALVAAAEFKKQWGT